LTAGGPAFIVEGNWFENGSRQLIESMKNYDPDAKEYGEADYRYMLVPASEEGKSVIFSQTGGSILVVKQEDEEKRAAIMDFLSFMLSDSNMGQVARQTGMLWNYNYKISQEHLDGMTKFARNAYDLLQDTQNVIVRSAFIDTASVPIYAYSALGTSYMTYNLSTQQAPLPALISGAGGDVQKFMQEIAAYNTADRWGTWLNQAKSYGYYS
jgi:ABC-type glycerol-3-phosphate transport system substrate-binding protein